ncbi:MAG: phage tail tape measure protein [Candidatus Cloacimonetes bacterium]|nr:phage tail tape measure protein [Candidatus Cloacimonadota bacterium]
MGGTAVVAGLGAMTKKFGDFDKAMRSATAVSDTTFEQFTEMSAMAEEQSIKLNLQVENLAEGFYFLGSAGLEATEQMKAFKDIALLSKAAQIDMGQATEMVVDTMKGFRMEFERTGEVVDMMAAGVTSSNMKFGQLGETLAYTSGIAKNMHTPLAKLIALTGSMADAGVKGSRAGTALRRAFLNLAAPTSQTAKRMKKLGIEVYDTATGKMKDMITILYEMEEAFKSMGEKEVNKALKEIFGARAITGMVKFFNEGVKQVDEFTEAIVNSGGTAKKVADKQLAAFNEQMGIISKKARLLINTLGEKLAPVVAKIGDIFGGLIDKITSLSDETLEFIAIATGIAGLTAVIEGGLLAIAAAASAVGVSIAPFVAIPVLLGAIGGAVYTLTKNTENLGRTTKDVNKQIRNEKAEFNSLMGILQDVNTSTETRDWAIGELQSKYGDYLKNINLETAGYDDLQKTMKKVNIQLENRIKIKALEEEMQEYTKRAVKLQKQINEKTRESIELENKYQRAEKYRNEMSLGLYKSRGSLWESLKKEIQETTDIEIESSDTYSIIDDKLRLYAEEAKKQHGEIREKIEQEEEELENIQDEYKNLGSKLSILTDNLGETTEGAKRLYNNIQKISGIKLEGFKQFTESIKMEVKESELTLQDFSDFYYNYLESREERIKRNYEKRLELLKEFLELEFITEKTYLKMKERLRADYEDSIKTDREEYLDFYNENIATEGEIYRSGIENKLRVAREYVEQGKMSEEELIQFKKKLWNNYKEWFIENNELIGGSLEALFDSIKNGYMSIVNDVLDGQNMMKKNWGEYMKSMANDFVRALNRMWIDFLAKKAMFAIIGLFTGGVGSAIGSGAETSAMLPGMYSETGGLVGMNGIEVADRGGMLGGSPHELGGTIIEAERGEYIINKESTDKYAPLLEAINADNLRLKNFDIGSGYDIDKSVYDFTDFAKQDNKDIVDKLNGVIEAINQKPVAKTQEIKPRDISELAELGDMQRGNKT